MPHSISYDVIILGAGGAGLMCAAIAGQRGKKVLLLDHAAQPGKKILISGGGRCNFTNLNVAAENFISSNPHFAKSALTRYAPADFIDLIGRHKISWHEKTLGQLFCDKSAKDIVSMLMAECNKSQVTFQFGEPILDVTHAERIFKIRCGGSNFTAPNLVVATGGLSIPKMGATGFAYDLARQFGLKIIEPRPALVSFTLDRDEALFQSLSGISTEVIVGCNGTQFREAALFTHKGLSGPAILQISSYWHHGESISIDFLPDLANGWLMEAKRQSPKQNLYRTIGQVLPTRLAKVLVQKIGLDQELANLPDQQLEEAEQRLARWVFQPTGTEGFTKAEVTIGGVNTQELSSQSMASNKISGLYFIGEAVDVTGWLGGYNFQWAWSSGWACGQAIK